MQRRVPRGFTLIEIMVVVVIVAVLAALTVPNLFAARNRGRDLQREAATLAARIRVAQDDAMLQGNEYGIVFSADGYRFVRWDAPSYRFRAINGGPSWTQRRLDDDVKVSASATSGEPILVLPEPADRKPDDKSAAATGTDAASGDEKDDEPQWEPSVFVLSSGEVTPFSAVFSAEGTEKPQELQIDALGNRIDADAPHAHADGESAHAP